MLGPRDRKKMLEHWLESREKGYSKYSPEEAKQISEQILKAYLEKSNRPVGDSLKK